MLVINKLLKTCGTHIGTGWQADNGIMRAVPLSILSTIVSKVEHSGEKMVSSSLYLFNELHKIPKFEIGI